MAVVVTLDQPPQGGFGQYTRRGTITLGAYATNGVAVARGDFSLPASLDNLSIEATDGYVPSWIKSTGKVKVLWTGTTGAVLDEVANATDLAAVAFRFEASGR